MGLETVAGNARWPCGPQGGLRVTHCDKEEDTKSGPGPGWAAPVSLLGSWPLRQVQAQAGRVQLSRATEAPKVALDSK
jgi:hypothetical protein